MRGAGRRACRQAAHVALLSRDGNGRGLPLAGPRPSARRSILAAIAVLSAACGAGGGDDTASGAPGVSTKRGRAASSAPRDGSVAIGASSTSSTTPPTVATTAADLPGRSAPVFAGDFPDPSVLYHDGVYHAYATQGSYGNVQLLRSRDLASWELLPRSALPKIPAWAAPYSVWAPAVAEMGDVFALYYTALEESSGLHCVSAAVSDSPAGPFVDPGTEPLVCPRDLGGAIDPSPVTDRDGDPWLLWKNDGVARGAPSAIYAQRLDKAGLSVRGDPVALIRTDQAWESPHVEAPSMLDAGGHFVLLYSGNWWNRPDYGVGFATCEDVHGPCTKPLDRPIISARPDAAGPGGAEFFTDAAGDPWVAYHAWLGGVAGYPGRRALWLERVDVSGEIPVLLG